MPLATIRAEGLRLQRGGVGFYPTSGSPFVHLDTGTVRHWPRILREELVKIFPDGRTVHIPADGHPLPGYALALADVERHGAVPSGTSLEAARAAGVITEHQEKVAAEVQPKRSLLARLFGRGKDEDEQSEQPARKVARAPIAVASLSAPRTRAGSSISCRSRRRGRSRRRLCQHRSQPARVMRRHRPKQSSLAALDGDALAYATEQQTPLAARTRPMGWRLPSMPMEARVIPTSSNTTLVEKPPFASTLAMGGGGRSDSPWLRAAMLTPSVRGYMTLTRVGAVDPRWQHELLHKPAQSLAMTFSADPHLGMVAYRFSGSAVVFLATTTFARPQTTASLH